VHDDGLPARFRWGPRAERSTTQLSLLPPPRQRSACRQRHRRPAGSWTVPVADPSSVLGENRSRSRRRALFALFARTHHTSSRESPRDRRCVPIDVRPRAQTSTREARQLRTQAKKTSLERTFAAAPAQDRSCRRRTTRLICARGSFRRTRERLSALRKRAAA